VRSTPTWLAILRGVQLFADCTDDELQEVDALLTEVDVAPGDKLTGEGCLGFDFFVIREGHAKVTRDGVTLGMLGPGSFVGEMALLDGSTRSATVSALTPMQVYAMSAWEFGELLRRSPSIDAKVREAAATRRALVEDLTAPPMPGEPSSG
jgi:CRP-like cAMP-binding protein